MNSSLAQPVRSNNHEEEGQRGNYKCRRCGQLKASHKCKFTLDDAMRSEAVQTEAKKGGKIKCEGVVIRVGVWKSEEASA